MLTFDVSLLGGKCGFHWKSADFREIHRVPVGSSLRSGSSVCLSVEFIGFTLGFPTKLAYIRYDTYIAYIMPVFLLMKDQ